MSFNPDKSHTLTISLQKEHLANPPIHFLNNPLEEVQSLKLLVNGLTISTDLSMANHILMLASKATRWASSIVQSTSLAHLNSFPPTRLSSTGWWSAALPSGLTPLPHILLSLMPWKTRPLRLLESPTMKLSLWANHFTIADKSVVSLFFHLLSGLALPKCKKRMQKKITLGTTKTYAKFSREQVKIVNRPLLSPLVLRVGVGGGIYFPVPMSLQPYPVMRLAM